MNILSTSIPSNANWDAQKTLGCRPGFDSAAVADFWGDDRCREADDLPTNSIAWCYERLWPGPEALARQENWALALKLDDDSQGANATGSV